jgi:hypothetical protein
MLTAFYWRESCTDKNRIPFERALDFANNEKITELLYPLFVHNIGALLYHPTNQNRAGVVIAAAERRKQEQNQLRNSQAPGPPRHSLAPHPGIGRPDIQRAHTFPTPPTSALSVMGKMKSSDGQNQSTSQLFVGFQRKIYRRTIFKPIESSPMHEEEPIPSSIGLGQQGLRSGMQTPFSPLADHESCFENNSQPEVGLKLLPRVIIPIIVQA